MRPEPRPARRRRLRANFGVVLASGVTTLSIVFTWAGTEPLGLVAGAGLALMALSALLSYWHLGRLRLAGPAELTTFSGIGSTLELEVSHRGWLTARDLLFTVHDGRWGSSAPTGHVGELQPGEALRVRCTPRFHERGRKRGLRVTLESDFPLGLFTAQAEYELELDLLVLPRILRLGYLAPHLPTSGGLDQESALRRGGSGDFHALRDWRAGESLRGIAWKLSARRGRLLTRELESDDQRSVRVVLVTHVVTLARSHRSPEFERAVCLAATLLDHFSRLGRPVALSLVGDEVQHLDAGCGRAALLAMLSALAEVAPSVGDPSASLYRALNGRDRSVPVVVLAGSGEDAGRPEGAVVLDVNEGAGWSRSVEVRA